MAKRINDTVVPDSLYGEAQAIRRRGGKCFIVIPEIIADEGTKLCYNCNGIGSIGLQVITGGPYDYVPPIQNKPDPPGSKDTPSRLTYIDGKRYKQKTRGHTCPICEGSGAFVKQPERAEPLAF